MGVIWALGAALWGFAEATLFFIVPDLLLNAAVLRLGLRKALWLCAVAAFGAMTGGLAMWHWGASDAGAARAALLNVPAVGPDLLARVQGEISSGWALHLALGPFTGAPYKLYAVEAGAAGVSPWLFALVSVPARLPRFIATTLLTALAQKVLTRWRVTFSPYALLALVWAVDYAFYFYMRS
jgi:membrane protein YqaA with SNARE-associated domain